MLMRDDGGFKLSESLDTQQRRESEITDVKKWMHTVLSIQHRELREERAESLAGIVK